MSIVLPYYMLLSFSHGNKNDSCPRLPKGFGRFMFWADKKKKLHVLDFKTNERMILLNY